MSSVNESKQQTSRMTMPSMLLRAEGIVLLVGAVLLYFYTNGSGLWLALLILAPDLSMVGYLSGPKVGSLIYNAVHSYLLPALLLAAAALTNTPVLLHLALIWFAHIGMDRTMGYGLKYTTAFRDTHLGRV